MSGYTGKTLGVTEALQAASEAADAFNLGPCSHVSSSSAHCFSTAKAFIRVSSTDKDPSETLEVATFLASKGVGPAVISEAPFLAGEATVEIYELLPVSQGQDFSPAELADAMVRLHSLDVETEDLPFERRVADARSSLEYAQVNDAFVLELKEELDALEALVATSSTDLVLCHADLHAGNIVKSRGEVKFLDVEFAGLATPAFDVALTFRSLQRHSSRADAQEFLSRYLANTRANLDIAEVLALSRARDIFGVCSMLPYAGEATARGDSARLRIATWKEVTKCTSWPLT